MAKELDARVNGIVEKYGFGKQPRLRSEGKPQRFGTQFSLQNGRLAMDPVEEPERLDERRAKYSLMPMEEYKKGLEKMYKRRVSRHFEAVDQMWTRFANFRVEPSLKPRRYGASLGLNRQGRPSPQYVLQNLL